MTVLLTFFLLPCVAEAAMHEWAPPSAAVPGSNPKPETTNPKRVSSLELEGGPSIFGGEVGIGLGIRGPLAKNFLVEVGGVLPHPVSGYASDSVGTMSSPFNDSYTARVQSFAETHLALLYPLVQTPRLMLDGGAGISIALVDDHTDHLTASRFAVPQTISTDHHKVLPAPLVLVGVRATLTERLSVRVEASYVHYANQDSVNAQSFELSVSGFLINPMLQIRL